MADNAELFNGILRNLYRLEALRLADLNWPPAEEKIADIAKAAVDGVNGDFPEAARTELEAQRDDVELALERLLRLRADYPPKPGGSTPRPFTLVR